MRSTCVETLSTSITPSTPICFRKTIDNRTVVGTGRVLLSAYKGRVLGLLIPGSSVLGLTYLGQHWLTCVLISVDRGLWPARSQDCHLWWALKQNVCYKNHHKLAESEFKMRPETAVSEEKELKSAVMNCVRLTQHFSGRQDRISYGCVATLWKQNTSFRELRVACIRQLWSARTVLNSNRLLHINGARTLPPETFSSSQQKPIYVRFCLPACLLATASHHPAPLSVSSYGLFNFCILCNDLALQYTGTTLQRSSVFHSTPHHVSVSYDVYTVLNIHRSSVLRHTTVWQISFRTKHCLCIQGKMPLRESGHHIHSHHRVWYVGTNVEQCAAPIFRVEASSDTLARHGVTNQKTIIWIFIAVNISNLMKGCTNPGRHFVVAPKLLTVAHKYLWVLNIESA